MRTSNVPLVTAAMVVPFVGAVEAAGHDPSPLLRKIGLSVEDLKDSEKYIPGQAWYDLSEASAALLCDQQLGFSIGAQSALGALPNLGILHLPHATLGELLNALVIDAPRITSLATYSLGTDGFTAWLETQRRFRPVGAPAQVDGYFAGFMLRIIQLCTGPAWDAGRVSITVSEPSAIPEAEQPGAIVKDHELRGAQFAFPAIWLLQRTDGVPRQALHVQRSQETSFVDTFRALLERHLDHPGLTLQRFAALTGYNVDGLKRSLASHGTSYAKERGSLRAARARMLLASTQEEISRIGELVGYPSAPGFTRSFRRWTGETPSHWRARNQSPGQN